MAKQIFIKTAIGVLGIEEFENEITQVFTTQEKVKIITKSENQLLQKAIEQLQEYFAGTRQVFNLPLATKGTDFQLKVWRALRAIPYGQVRTYKEIAEAIGQPKACRAVGGANNKNPLMIVTPCHRVIGANNSLVGFADGLDVKAQLLTLEGLEIVGGKVCPQQ